MLQPSILLEVIPDGVKFADQMGNTSQRIHMDGIWKPVKHTLPAKLSTYHLPKYILTFIYSQTYIFYLYVYSYPCIISFTKCSKDYPPQTDGTLSLHLHFASELPTSQVPQLILHKFLGFVHSSIHSLTHLFNSPYGGVMLCQTPSTFRTEMKGK